MVTSRNFPAGGEDVKSPETEKMRLSLIEDESPIVRIVSKNRANLTSAERLAI